MNVVEQTKQIYLISDNKYLPLSYDIVRKYLSEIFDSIKLNLDVDLVVSKVYPKLKFKNSLSDLRNQIIMSSSEMITDHFDYPKIAIALLIDDLHKKTDSDYGKVVDKLYLNINEKGEQSPIINSNFYEYVKQNINVLNEIINYKRDYDINLFGYRTLERAYLKKDKQGNIIERPQHMYMRIAVAIHYRTNRLDRIIETYELLSEGYFSHATPTYFNAGSLFEQLSSCFLLSMNDDMSSIGECWKHCALISKFAGGVGINVTNIRANGSFINSTQGISSGMRLLTVFNQISRYADQGGKRAGSFAMYLEPWHADIYFFLGLMIDDIFMERVRDDAMWSLMCPSECPDLLNKYGKNFSEAYTRYENEGKFKKQIKARALFFKIMEIQYETGIPYIIYKNAANAKSNQQNIGVINCSNLCAEILEYSSSDEYGVCNLASICLPKFVNVNTKEFDFDKLFKVVKIVTRNLDNIIDINYYPVIHTKKSNIRHRPIGVGVQGLADLFAIMKIPFDSKEARKLNKDIFETIYFGTMTESNQLAKEYGYYETYPGSPISEGKFQFNLWGLNISDLSGKWNWEKLKDEIKLYGIRNSLTTACMPTASTSQIMGNNECIEAYTSNIYSRSTLAGEYTIVNKYLMKDLIDLNLWNSNTLDLIKYYEGSIKQIDYIPDNIKEIYRTIWEIPQKSIIEMSADRGPFIDQTQSLNIHIAIADFSKLIACHFLSWELGLKTGIYYLRSKPASDANKFGIDISTIEKIKQNHDNINLSCKKEHDCTMCSS